MAASSTRPALTNRQREAMEAILAVVLFGSVARGTPHSHSDSDWLVVLRQVGIDPPRLHDVRPVLVAEHYRFPAHLRERIQIPADDSQWLRAQREHAFYGDVEWIPTERYGPGDGSRALAAGEAALELATMPIEHG